MVVSEDEFNLPKKVVPAPMSEDCEQVSKLSTVQGAHYELMLEKWSQLPDLNWGHPDVC